MSIVMIMTLIMLAALVVILTGITRNDLRALRTERDYRCYPHARRWRERPTIATSGKHAVALRRTYRKLVTPDDNRSTDWLLHIPDHLTIVPGELPATIRQFISNPAVSYVTILPAISTPMTLSELFRSSHLIITAPFALARSGLGIAPSSTHPYIINRSMQPARSRTKLYILLCLAVCAAMIAAIVIALKLVVLSQQPELFLVFLAGFAAWSLWSIGSYPHLSYRQKVYFAVLLPATLGYFVCCLVSTPVRLLARLIMPRGAIIKT